jgi:hypothetical protein
MRILSLLALLFMGCTEAEINENFIEGGSTRYFAFLADAKAAVGIKFDPDGELEITFEQTGADGFTPADICLDGWIGTIFGDIYAGCLAHDIHVRANGKFSANIEAQKDLWVTAVGVFREDDTRLDFTLRSVGSVELLRCDDATCDELRGN